MATGITRREGLAGLAVAAAATSGMARGAMLADDGLKPAASIEKIAAARTMRFGSCVAWGTPGRDAGSFANPHYAALLTRDCGLLVAENEMKWQALRPTPERFAFARFDEMLVWAERHGFAMRGHNLLWNQPKWMPAWVNTYDFGAHPAAAGEKLLTTHINTVCKRYGTRIGEYDVVNEAVNPKDGSLYETSLSRAIGGAEPTLDLAFHTAHQAAPDAKLVYNDYMSWEPGGEAHRAGVLKLLEGFKARGVPVDALGVQSHIAAPGPDIAAGVAAQEGAWRAFLDQVTGMGYGLVVTELDVHDNKLPADIAARDREVADYVRSYLDIMFAYPELRDVLVWGMTDRYSWLQGFAPRADGKPCRPCPYDAHFQPKPMRGAIADAFAATSARAA